MTTDHMLYLAIGVILGWLVVPMVVGMFVKKA